MSSPTSSSPPRSSPASSAALQKRTPPAVMLAIVTASVFVAEALVMVVLVFFHLPRPVEVLIDSGLLILLVSPMLYFYLLRPLTLEIAERKKAERDLQTAKELVENMFSFSQLLIAYLDPQFNFIRVNQAYAEAGGHTPDYFQGKNHFDLYPNPENEAIFTRVVETGQPFFVDEKAFEYADHPEWGTTYWDWSLFPIKDSSGKVTRIILSLVDVSQRKRAQLALADSERRFRAIFNQTFQFTGLMQPDGRLLEANQTALDFAGVQHSEVAGRPFWETVWWSHSPEAQEHLKAAIAEAALGKFMRYEVEAAGRNGEMATIDFSIKPVKDEDGQIVLLIPEGRDITRRKQAEDALRQAHAGLEQRVQERTAELKRANAALQAEILERTLAEDELRDSEQKLRSVIEQSHDGIFLVDEQGMIIEWNEAQEQITGLKAADVLGQAIWDIQFELVPDEVRTEEAYERLKKDTQDLLKKGAHPMLNVLVDRPFERKDGAIRSLQEVAFPIKTENGFMVGSISRDTTERKREEESLRTALEVSQQRQAEVTALLEGARSVLELRDFKLSARSIYHACKRIIGASAGFITLVREDAHEVLFLDPVDSEIQVEPGAFLPIQGMSELVYQSGQIAYTNDFSDPAWVMLLHEGHARPENAPPENAPPENMPPENALYAPLSIHGVVVGLLGLGNKPGGFNENDVRMATAFGELTAIALLNYETEQALRRAHAELETRVLERTAELARANQELLGEIAERKRIEAQLRLQTTAVEAAANGILLTDREGRILWCNPAFSTMTGYSSAEVAGQTLRFQKSGKHTAQEYSSLWRTILAGQVWHGEMINRRKDGSLYDEEQMITPVRDENGEITHFIAIKQDITARKQAEDETRRRNQELATLNAVSAAICSSLELPEILGTLRQLLVEELDIPAGAIYFYDQARDRLNLETIWGIPEGTSPSTRWIPVSNFPSEQVIRNYEIVFTADVRQSGVFTCLGVDIPPSKWRSYVCIPLVAQGRTQGILELFRLLPASLLPSQINFFKALGREVGIAVHNAQLYAAELRARQTAETLCAASQALTQSLSLDFVMNTLLDHVGRLIPYDNAHVLMLEDEAHLSVRAARGNERWEPNQQVLSKTIDTPSSPRFQNLVSEQKSILISDTRQDPEWKAIPGMEHVRSLLSVPLIAGGKVIGLCSLDKTQPGFFTPEHIQWAEALVSQAAVAIQNAWLFEQVRAGHERLQSLSHRLVEVQETERHYIARELHDEAGQALTTLMVGLRLLERDVNQPEAILQGIAELKRMVDGVLENLHRLAVDLRPASLDYLGLVPALRQHIEAVSDKHGLVIQFEALGLESRLPPEFETALYRIVQEALTNAIRHAQATRIDVLLEQRGDQVILMIEDNGVGFDPLSVIRTDHLGLFGMRERAEMLGGKLLIESAAGSGTTILVEVPYVHSNPHRR